LFVIFVLRRSAFSLTILGISRKAFVGIFGFMRVERENKCLGKITAAGGYSGSGGQSAERSNQLQDNIFLENF